MAGSQALRSVCFVLATALFGVNLLGDQLPARHHQGDAHAFLVLKNLEGKRLATGDVTVVTHGARVTARLIFRFRDGSIDDDTTVFSQDGMIRLISDHHIQKGPSFPHPVDAAIDAVTGQITMITADGKRSQEHLDLPADVANGLPPNLAPEYRSGYDWYEDFLRHPRLQAAAHPHHHQARGRGAVYRGVAPGARLSIMFCMLSLAA